MGTLSAAITFVFKKAFANTSQVDGRGEEERNPRQRQQHMQRPGGRREPGAFGKVEKFN